MNERLFVYGIFLDRRNGGRYGFLYEREHGCGYATVADWATVGEFIVRAVPAPGYTLTGLLVAVPELHRGQRVWPHLDSLEAGYKRIQVTTEDGAEAFMYVDRSAPGEDHSTWRARVGAVA